MTNGRPTPHELLSAYHDGELTAAERQEVERLLEDSPDARAELEDYRALSEMLRGMSAEPVPAGTRAAVMRRIERELLVPAALPVPSSRKSRRRLWVLAGLLTSAAAIVLVAVIADRNLSGKPDNRLVAAAKPGPRSEPAGSLPRLERSLGSESAPAPMAREPVADENLAEKQADAAALASVSNAAVANSLALGKDTATGDVLSYLEQRSDGEVVVVQATVVDVRTALNSLQVLLAKNSIPMQPTSFGAMGGVGGAAGFGRAGTSLGVAADKPVGELEAVYVESGPAQINATLADLGREKDQFVDVQVAGILNSTPNYGEPFGMRSDRLYDSYGMPARGLTEERRHDNGAILDEAEPAAAARARWSIPAESFREKQAAPPPPAAVPTTRAFEQLEAAKPDLPLAGAAEPAASANTPAADQSQVAFGFQTTLNLSRQGLQQQLQPADEAPTASEAGEAINYFYYQTAPSSRSGTLSDQVEVDRKSERPLNREEDIKDFAKEDSAKAGAKEAEVLGRGRQQQAQQQRRMRLLVVLERRGEEPIEKAAKLKADVSRQPVEAPRPASKKG